MVERAYKFENGYIEVRGWWLNVSDVLESWLIFTYFGIRLIHAAWWRAGKKQRNTDVLFRTNGWQAVVGHALGPCIYVMVSCNQICIADASVVFFFLRRGNLAVYKSPSMLSWRRHAASEGSGGGDACGAYVRGNFFLSFQSATRQFSRR